MRTLTPVATLSLAATLALATVLLAACGDRHASLRVACDHPGNCGP